MVVFLWVLVGIILFLMIRLSVMVQYGERGLLLRAWFGPLGVTIYPRVKKKPKKEKEEKKEKKEEEEVKAVPKGGSVAMLRAGLSMVGPMLERVKRRLVIRELCLHYTAATDDAAMTAFAYGGAHAAVSAILPRLRYHFRVKKEDIRISVNFESQEDEIFVRLKLSISIWSVICLGLFSLLQLKRSGLLAILKEQRKKEKQERETPAKASSS